MDVIRCDHLNASIARTIVLITVNEQSLSANTSCEFSAKINNEPAAMKIAIEKYTTILGILPHGPITSFATALQDNRVQDLWRNSVLTTMLNPAQTYSDHSEFLGANFGRCDDVSRHCKPFRCTVQCSSLARKRLNNASTECTITIVCATKPKHRCIASRTTSLC